MLCERIDMRGEGSQEYAALYTYVLDHSDQLAADRRPMIIVCPGGAYTVTSDREAELVALQFCAMGYHAAVLRYSVAPAVYPAANLELGRAIAMARARADDWRVDPDRIIPLGFSAGGHMVASYCMSWNAGMLANKLGTPAESLRPAGMMLSYPVISSAEPIAHIGSFKNLLGEAFEEKKDEFSLERWANGDTPRTFIWHTFQDSAVPVQNSLLLASALVEQGVPVELHVFEKGHHGLSLANRTTQAANGGAIEPSCESWIQLARVWLEGM